MQISVLRKLLPKISRKTSLKDKRRLVETSEPREASEEVQSAECKVQNCRGENCSSECKTLSDDDNPPVTSTESDPPCSTDLTEEGDMQNTKTDEAQAQPTDTKAHLTSSVPRSARAPIGVLTKSEIGELRNIFANLSDTEIQRLYKRVTKQN